MKKFVLSLTGALLLFAGAALIINPVAAATPPPSGGKDLVGRKCSVCHSLGRVEEHQGKKDGAWWVTTVERMISKGAKLDKQQKRSVVQFLITGN